MGVFEGGGGGGGGGGGVDLALGFKNFWDGVYNFFFCPPPPRAQILFFILVITFALVLDMYVLSE